MGLSREGEYPEGWKEAIFLMKVKHISLVGSFCGLKYISVGVNESFSTG